MLPKITLAICGLLLLCIVWDVSIKLYRWSTPGFWKHASLPRSRSEADKAIKQTFLAEKDPCKRYNALFEYFATHALLYSTPQHERIHYPGAGGNISYEASGLEGFARTSPLLAAWIYANGTASPSGIDLVDFVKKGILAGTDSAQAWYWGDFHDYDPRVVAAADIARTLWLTRAYIWDTLNDTEKQQITSWIDQVNRVTTVQNNWLLFPIVVNVLMSDLGALMSGYGHETWERYKADYYRESGWFVDPPHKVDYYNVWAISYDMFWIHYVDRTFDPEFMSKALAESATLTAHLISPKGVPIMGRSVCYRGAVSAPIVAQALLDPSPEEQGRALRALTLTWSFFIAGNSLREGSMSQGYFDPDMRFFDNYSGPGSSQWSTRSLVLALMNSKINAFWEAHEQSLPVELGDYDLSFPKLGWQVLGDKKTQNITIRIPANTPEPKKIETHTLKMRLVELVRQRPCRPENEAVKYNEREYHVLEPYPLRVRSKS